MMRTVEFRYYTVRNGADYIELHAVEGSEPKIIMDDSGSIKTKLSGSFLTPGEEVNWLTDEIRPVMILDGVPYRLGLFSPTKADEPETETMKSVHIDAYDRGWIVRDHIVEHAPYFPAGTNYLSAVGSILMECGITNVSIIPTEMVLTEAGFHR